MRKTTLSVAATVFGFCCFSQQTSTNTMRYPDKFRVVGSRVFNIEKDTNWVSLGGECETVFTNGIAVRTHAAPRIYPDRSVSIGNMLGDTRSFEPYHPPIPYYTRVFITNYPADKSVGIGNQVYGQVLKLGMLKTETGEQLQVYDWGKPWIVKIIKTNSP